MVVLSQKKFSSIRIAAISIILFLVLIQPLSALNQGDTYAAYSSEATLNNNTESYLDVNNLNQEPILSKLKGNGEDQSRYSDTSPDSLARLIYHRLSDVDHPDVPELCFKESGSEYASTQTKDVIVEKCLEALNIVDDLQDRKFISQTYNQLYLIYYNIGNFDVATMAAERSLAIAEELHYLDMMARGQQNFAILNSVRGRYLAAIEHFLRSEEYYLDLNNDLALSQLYLNIGITFEQAGNIEKAYEYMQKGLSISNLIENDQYRASAMANIGTIHSREGRADSAFYYYSASLEISEQLGLDDLIIQNLDNIGAYYSTVDDYETATTYLMSAYQMAEITGQSFQKIYITDHLAKNYLAANNPDSARKYAEIQLNLAYDYDFLYDQQLAYSNLADVYASLNEFDKAFEAHQNYSKVKDSLLNLDRMQQLEDLRERYETEQREQTISMLTLEAETATFRRNTYLASGILVSLILLMLYTGQRYKARRNRQLLEKSEEVALMKSNFFSNISHEFRTPLTLITGPIQKLRTSINDPGIRHELDIMQKNSDRLLSLINQLLDLSRLESGTLALSVEKTELTSLVKGVVMSFQSYAEHHHIQLITETGSDFMEAWVDRPKLETILINLTGNALKFTPDDGNVTVSLQNITKSDGLEWGRIIISDTGNGIHEEDLEHVFDRFYRGSDKEQSGIVGSGIGLALTRELVHLHKGEISVKSENGRGTVFFVDLPVSRKHYHESEITSSSTAVELLSPVHSVSETPALPPDEIESDSASPLLLLIEDNADVMNYLRDILNSSYRIITSTDGEAGVETALEEIPDLIISDVMMPKMNGYRVAEILKQDEKTSHIPLILLTAKASHDDKIQGLKTHADDYITKPFRPDELLLRVENLITSRKKLSEKYNRKIEIKPEELSTQSMEEVFLIRVIDSIKKHLLDEEFTVDILAREVGMSRSQLHRKLVAITDLSASDFIRSYRLNLAREKIENKTGSISEIAYEVGFNSPSYFSKAFKEKFGVSPSEFEVGIVNGEGKS
jgi:signal transduction histidine kinase/DNA-binding response OmpR family regulator